MKESKSRKVAGPGPISCENCSKIGGKWSAAKKGAVKRWRGD